MSQQIVIIMSILIETGRRLVVKSLPYRHNTESFTSATAIMYQNCSTKNIWSTLRLAIGVKDDLTYLEKISSFGWT